MDLVAAHLAYPGEDRAGAGRPAPDLRRRLLVAGRCRDRIEESETLVPGPRIDDPAAEHPVATGDPDDWYTPFPGEPEFLTGPRPPEHLEILYNILRPREDDTVVAGERRPRRGVIHRSVALEELKVGEVYDPREANDGDLHGVPGRLPAFIRKRERIFARERYIRIRDHPEDRDARELLELLHSRCEEPEISPELVDDYPGDERPDIIGEEGERPVDLCKDPAALDIGDEDDRKPEAPCEPDVCYIAIVEVHLRRPPGPFHHDVPVAALQPPKRRHSLFEEPVSLCIVVTDLHVPVRPAEQDHLRRPIAHRFEEDRVHIGYRLDTRGEGLHGLGHPDLAPVSRDVGVEAHIL